MQPVTRMELLDHIEDAFAGGPVTRSKLVEAAVASHARGELLAVLHQLPDVEFREIRDLWRELADMPISA